MSSDSNQRLSRRSALKGVASLALGAAFGCGESGELEPDAGSADAAVPTGDDAGSPTDAGQADAEIITVDARPERDARMPDPSNRRLAIIGGGAAGLMTGYFLHRDWEVEVFESRAKLGGHCDTVTVDFRGQPYSVDLGAQFFHPDTHPMYATLLEEIGVFDPERADHGLVVEAPGGVAIFAQGGTGLPHLASVAPLLSLVNAATFATYTQEARKVVQGDLSWDVPLADWVGSLDMSDTFKRDVLWPWLSATMGASYDETARVSARSLLSTFALAFPENVFAGASTYNSRIGLMGNLLRLVERSPGLSTHVDAAITSVTRDENGWYLDTAEARHGPFAAVVNAAPPHAGKQFLAPLDGFADVVESLSQVEYFRTRMLIHTDPVYMHQNKDIWATYNTELNTSRAEASVWYGAVYEPVGNERVSIFKSWASERTREPANIAYERVYKHPLIDSKAIATARAIQGFQGRDGMYFAGQSTTALDLQEACIASAIRVADMLAPDSAPLASLRMRLASRGRTDVCGACNP